MRTRLCGRLISALLGKFEGGVCLLLEEEVVCVWWWIKWPRVLLHSPAMCLPVLIATRLPDFPSRRLSPAL
jgi:hypothetical protein